MGVKIEKQNHKVIVEFDTGTHCELCKDSLDFLEKVFMSKFDDVYGGIFIRGKFLGKRFPGILITPDHNSNGRLTHTHAEIYYWEDKEMEKFFETIRGI